jgi:hypothetical protein
MTLRSIPPGRLLLPGRSKRVNSTPKA